MSLNETGRGSTASADPPEAAGISLAWLEFPTGRASVHESCSIGRSASNHVFLAGEKISRRHAVIQQHGAHDFWLMDLGSCNGTWLNGRRITQATRLYDQDEIAIGPYVLVFHHPNGKTRSRPEFTVTDRTLQEIKTVSCWLLVGNLEAPAKFQHVQPPLQAPQVMSNWLDACKDIIEQHGGRIHKYLADGFFAYWHDQRTASAAVARLLVELKPGKSGGHPASRLVLHFGAVIMRSVAKFQEESFSGSSVNFVFRMEKLANALQAPILVSEAAHSALDGHLPLSEAGRRTLEGFEGDFLFYQF